LHKHAERNGSWDLQVSATQTLYCCIVQHTGGAVTYLYWMNNEQIDETDAQRLLLKVFEEAVNA
jgi:hypothetical protein